MAVPADVAPCRFDASTEPPRGASGPVVNLSPEGLCRSRPSFGILSSYPPTACGLATFSAALASGMRVHDAEVGVVRIVERPGLSPRDGRVVGELVNGSPRSLVAASEMLNQFDVAGGQ